MYRKIGMTEAYDQYSIIRIWEEVVGETIARMTKVERLNSGELIVRVTNPSWRMELSFRRKEIAERINKVVGREMVRSIVFR